ncbi:MAG: DUF2304 domain-containing protein [Chloroflexota bacterium]|jgi:hypothetical protein
MTIELSQIIIVSVMLGFALYVFRGRTVLRDRIIYLVLLATGVVLAIYPDLSTRIANTVGIGRGTDLLLYVFILFSLFYYAGLASQFMKVEQQITALTRAIAILNAKPASEKETNYHSGDDT